MSPMILIVRGHVYNTVIFLLSPSHIALGSLLRSERYTCASIHTT